MTKLSDLFKSKNVQGITSISDVNEDVESQEYVEEYIKEKFRYENIQDFSTASNFAIFGSAQEYYDSGIESIQNNYPYDGSAKEKLEWVNSANPLDLYIFEKEYPRTNGYVIFNVGAVSTATTSGSVNNHRRPTTKEYIYFVGGPHVDNIWNTSSFRSSNLEMNGGRGNTVEFWLKKEAFSTSNRREVILDVWRSGTLSNQPDYGRFTIELDQQNQVANKSPFVITYKSGSTGVHQAQVGAVQLAASASDNSWHHYAFTIQNTGSSLSIKTYVDGKLNHVTMTGSAVGRADKSLVSTIGALATGKAGRGESEDPPYNTPGNSNLGWGKLSGSIDEFRYWKVMRSQKDISRHWFTQVNGGTNTVDSNTTLGVYFKFNEGIGRTDDVGKIILDYAGRVSNGTFVNYTSSNRRTDSAIVQSGVAKKEFKDPIIHSDNARLIKFKQDKKTKGNERDLLNSSALINSVPSWILEEDLPRGNIKKLLQIIGSYFDVLYAQIRRSTELKHVEYTDYDEKKPFPHMRSLLASYGVETDEMFMDATALEIFGDRTEDFEFENKLHDVKNMIYKNLYNSLVHINKAKGTEKALRNILRTHGVDEELIELKNYSDGQTYEIRSNYRENVHKTNVINFHKRDNQIGSVFQFSSSFGTGPKASEIPTRGFITGSSQQISTEGLSFTTEVEVIFPYLFSQDEHDLFTTTPLSSSIFGAHTVPQTPSLNWTTAAKDFANFHVAIAKDHQNSQDARFVLSSRSGRLNLQQSKLFTEVYSGQKWNLAFRLRPSGSAFGNAVSGSNAKYTAELFGVTVEGNEVRDKFLISQDLNQAQGQDFHKFSKRIFAGAERNNTDGAVVMQSDIQLSYVRHWLKYLDDETIVQHARDSKNAGIKDASKRAFTTHSSINQDILNSDTLALHWSFDTLTGSSAGGNLAVLDASSGSANKVSQFGPLGQIIAYNHPGRGVGFQVSSTSSVLAQYFPTYRETGFENIRSSDMVKVRTSDENTFKKGARPSEYFFSFEKSMYKTISQEMIDMFASVTEYSNLIGNPINRYRPNYKAMEKIRAKFFENVENTPSFERFMEFYRWIDSSISTILDQYIPASANYSDGIKNIVESHDLERNKYWTKFPTLEKKDVEPSANILGVNELLYDWEHGHAPLTTNPRNDNIPAGDNNCLWRKDRAIRTTDAQVFGKRPINEKSIRFASNGDAVSIPDSNVFSIGDGSSDSPFSFSAWVYIGDVTADSGVFTSKRDSVAGTAEYFFGHVLGNINLFIYDGNTSNRLKYVSTGKLSSTTWHHIAITYDGGATSPKHNGVNVYVDGALFAGAKSTDGTYVASHNTATEAYIGATKNPTTNTFEDFIADVVYFDKALTAAEVTEIRNGGKVYDMTKFSAINNIIAWYKMGDDQDAAGSGGIKDYINSHHATLVGGAAIVAQSPASDSYRFPLSELNTNRETIRRVANTDVSGSTYAIRKLTRPYRLQAGFQHVLHAGDNFHLNKKKDFFKATTNPGSEDFISVDATKINVDTCSDVHVPRYRLQGGQVFEKKRYGGEANISDTNRDHDINTVLPFSLYTSSVTSPVGYQKFIADEFKKGVDITNLHNDAYGDDREIPIQGPFHQQHIGGHFHRHLETNRGSKEELDQRGDRREAFFISASNGELFVLNPDMEGRLGPKKFNTSFTGSYAGRVNFMREPLAKRPVNIRNIRTTTGSAHLGNYQHVYQAVMGTSPEMSKTHAVHNLTKKYPVKVFLSQSSGVSGFTVRNVTVFDEFSSSYFFGYKDRVRPPRKTAKHVITSRFSAPGGPETAGDAHGGPHIDVATNQLSIYNNLNYRNMTQRLMLDMFASEKQEQFGHRFKSSITASVPTASFHKVNRNHRYIGNFAAGTEGNPRGGEHDILVRSDNQFVQHHIPQSDLGYSWIRKSAKETTGSYRGHQNRFTHPVGLSISTSSAPIFISSSAIGVAKYERNSNGNDLASRFFGLLSEKVVENDVMHLPTSDNGVQKIKYTNMERITHVGLNNIIRDNVTSHKNTLGFEDDLVLQHNKQSWFGRNRPFIKNPYWNGALWDFKRILHGLPDGKTTSGITSYKDTNTTDEDGISIFAHLTGALDTIHVFPSVTVAESSEDLGHFIVGTGSSNIQGHVGIHLLLNALIANRGGNLGYNSWNQMRAGQHKLARRLRKDNVFNFVASKIQLRIGTNEDANVDKFRFMSLAPFVKSTYNWPDDIQFAKATRARRVGHPLTQFTESAATSNNLPVRFQSFFLRDEQTGVFTKVSPTAQTFNPHAAQTVSITYDNAFENFSNEDMKDFLRISDLNPPRYLINFAGNETIQQANTVRFGRTIFPRDENVFMQKIRARKDFKNQWANTDDRSLSVPTTQNQFLLSGSLWPLAGYQNFKTAEPIKLGSDLLGDKHEGELMTSTGIFRGGSFGRGFKGYPSPAATYARKWVETPQVYKIHIKQDAFSYTALSGAGVATGSLREATFFMGAPQRLQSTRARPRNFITIVPPHHPDTNTVFPRETLAYIKLSESATTTRAAVDQIVDGLNSYEGNDAFSTNPFVFKDIARARASADKRTVIIEVFQAYENSSFPVDTPFGKQFHGGNAGWYDQDQLNSNRLLGNDYFKLYASRMPKGSQFGLSTMEFNMPSTYADHDGDGTTDKPFEDRGQAASAFFSASISRNAYLAGGAKYEVGHPWNNHSSYGEWSEELRKFKDYSVVPEYRISEEMSSYIGVNAEDPFFECPQGDFLSLTGSDESFNNSEKDKFYQVLSHSDFLKNFNTTFEQLKEIDPRTRPDTISLTCRGVKKLLPYEGFYPSQRVAQLAGLFNDSYGPDSRHVGENYNSVDPMSNYRNILAPFYAPGLAFNSIKSGIAVDYPLFVPKKDRPFAAFSTEFVHNDDNKVLIGGAKDWAHVLTGSASRDRVTLGSFKKGPPNDDRSLYQPGRGKTINSALRPISQKDSPDGISVSMWIKPDSQTTFRNATGRASLISFGGAGTATDTPGVQFYLPTTPDTTGSLRLALSGTITTANGFYLGATETQSGAEHIYSSSVGPLKMGEWNFVGFSVQVASAYTILQQAPKSPIVVFRCNEHTVTASLSHHEGSGYQVRKNLGVTGSSGTQGGSALHTGSTFTMDTRFLNLKGKDNCMIGNSTRTQGAPGSFPGRISEVCIYNSFLNQDDYDGLFGGGVGQRGPWRPDMCVTPKNVNSIVGWYRMGNDSGLMSLSASAGDDANLTNRTRMKNKAWPAYANKHYTRAPGPILQSEFFHKHDGITGSAIQNEVAASGFPYGEGHPNVGMSPLSIVTASFSGFTQSTAGIKQELELTGAYKYPSYITGSLYNETADGGIPRIGSASWAAFNNITSIEAKSYGSTGFGLSNTQKATLSSWQTGSSKQYGIDRIDRLPFEAIVDPTLATVNFLKDTGEGIEERFIVFDTEPHPSASLQPCSYSKFQTSTEIIARIISFREKFVGAHTTSGLDGYFAEGNLHSQNIYVASSTKSIRIRIRASERYLRNYENKDTIVVGGTTNAALGDDFGIGSLGVRGVSTSNFIDQLITIIKKRFGSGLRVTKNSDSKFTISDGTEKFIAITKNQDLSGDFTSVIPSALDTARTPKTSLDDNENLRSIIGQPVTSSVLTSSLNITSMKAAGDTLYTNAANNFYAETMNFFLDNGHSTVLVSSDSPKTTVDYGKTYKMKVRLSKVSPGVDFPIYDQPQAFGPALDAGAPPRGYNSVNLFLPGAGGNIYLNNLRNAPDFVAHGYSGYTPPHYDKMAEVEYTFTPDENENYEISNPGAIETIINRISINNKTSPTIKYNRFIKATGSNQDSTVPKISVSGFTNSSIGGSNLITTATASLNKTAAMQLSASFRGMGLEDSSLISVFREGSAQQDIMRKQFVIQSKWECPNISFADAEPTQTKIPGISVPKGLWHQKGKDSQVAKIEILPPSNRQDGDLGQLLGMKFRKGGIDKPEVGQSQIARSSLIGQTVTRKRISEAVVAIPFLTLDGGEKQFLHFDSDTTRRIYQEVKMFNGHSLYRSFDTTLGRADQLLEDRASGTNQFLQALPTIEQEVFVQNMVTNMIQHVLPPKLNFLKYNNQSSGKYVQPYLMYLFPFTHTLTKQDLQDIWQNLPPAIGRDTFARTRLNSLDSIEQSVTLSHTIDDSPLSQIIQNDKTENLRWMIFKVKKSAQKDYFQKMDLDRLPIGHPDRNLPESELFKCGFNWPYDYFSLVELIKLKADVVFAKFTRPRRITTGGRNSDDLGAASQSEVDQARASAEASRADTGDGRVELL